MQPLSPLKDPNQVKARTLSCCDCPGTILANHMCFRTFMSVPKDDGGQYSTMGTLLLLGMAVSRAEGAGSLACVWVKEGRQEIIIRYGGRGCCCLARLQTSTGDSLSRCDEVMTGCGAVALGHSDLAAAGGVVACVMAC